MVRVYTRGESIYQSSPYPNVHICICVHVCICTVLAFVFVLYLPSYLYCTYLRFCTVLAFVFVLHLPSYLYCTCICFLVRRWVNNLEALTHKSGAADLVLFC